MEAQLNWAHYKQITTGQKTAKLSVVTVLLAVIVNKNVELYVDAYLKTIPKENLTWFEISAYLDQTDE